MLPALIVIGSPLGNSDRNDAQLVIFLIALTEKCADLLETII